MTLVELPWFNVEGFFYDVEEPNPAGTITQPQLLDISGYVNFYPGSQGGSFPSGFAALVHNLDHGDGTSGDTMVALAPITARFMNGALCTVAVGDPVGIELLAGSTIFNLTSPLYYHVDFSSVTYGGGDNALSDFAFQAPTDQDAPTSLAATPLSSGGSLAAGTYYYGVTAVLLGGETQPSNIVSVTVSGSTSLVNLVWDLPSTALALSGFNIYRGTAANALNKLVASVGPTVANASDTGASPTTQTPPLNSAGTAYVDQINLTSPLLPQFPYAGPGAG